MFKALRNLWSPVEVRRTIAATPTEIFATLAEPRTYPEWLVGAKRIRYVDPSFPAPGATFGHEVGAAGPVTVEDETDVIASDPPHRLELMVHVGPMDGRVELLVQPHAEGSEVVMRERPHGPFVVLTPLMRPILGGRNASSLRQLAERFERTGAAST